MRYFFNGGEMVKQRMKGWRTRKLFMWKEGFFIEIIRRGKKGGR